MPPDKGDRAEAQRRMSCRVADYTTREENGELYIDGYFAVFNSPYHICDGVTEYVAPGAFAETLDGDIRALTNHDTTLVLGRTKIGTLTLREDARGLFGTIRINRDDVDAMNLYNRVRRGDVDQCSFGFEILEETVDYKDDGSVTFTILRVRLFEVSVVTFPAYEDTAVVARTAQIEHERQRKLEIKRAELRARLKGEK